MYARLKKLAESKGIRLTEGWRVAAGDVWAKLRGEGLLAVVLRGSVGAFLVRFAGAALSFLAHLVAARALGVGSYGTFIYVYTWILILAVLCRVGFRHSLIRFVAQYRVNEEWRLLRGLSRRSFHVVALAGGLVALGVVLCAGLLPQLLGTRRAAVFAVAALGIPFLALMGVEHGMLRGLKRVVLADLPERVLRPGLLAAVTLVLLLVLGGGALDAVTVTAVHTGAMALAFAAGAVFLWRVSPHQMRERGPSSYETRRWLAVSFPLFLITGMNMLSRQVSLIMVGSLADDSAAGLLGIGLRLSLLVRFGQMASNMIAAPLIAELYYAEEHRDLQRLLKMVAWGIFVFTLFAAGGLILCGPWLLEIFGSGFRAAYVPLIIIVVGQIINSLCGPVMYILQMTGRQSRAAVVVAGSMVVQLLLCLVLIPAWGALGAALAMSVGIALCKIVMVFQSWWTLELNPTIFPFRSFVRGAAQP